MARVNKQSPDHRHLAMQVLSWMAQSRRPIGLRELRHALAAAEHTLDLDEETIPYSRLIDGVCFGLVTMDKVRDTVRLVHSTTTEYFQKRWTYWVPDANAHIATACINYLNFDRFASPIAESLDEYCARLRVNYLYEYAALYWGDHAREAYPQVIGLVAKILRSGPKLLNAVHVLDSSPNHFPFLGRTNGVTSLHVAAYFGIVEQLSELMKEGENHSALDSYGRSALHWAAKNGQQQAIELLVPQGIDVSGLDGRMESALHYSARQGYVDLVELLIQFGSQVEGRNSNGETPLLVAVNNVNTAALQRLLAHGADPNATDKMGRNALHYACKGGAISIVKALLDRGSSIDTPDHDGRSALHFAVSELQRETVKAIFRMDESLARSYCMSVDAKGRTLLHHLLQADFSSVELTELLLAYGAGPNCTDNDGHSPLSTYLGTFKIGSRTATCRLLLQHGGNPYWSNSAGQTLAHLAVCEYNAEPKVLEALSDCGVDLSRKDASGKCILHHGGIGGSLSSDILNFLHDRNLFDPYDRDADGKTPLDYASEEAQRERDPDLFCGSRWEKSLKALQDFIEMKSL